MYTDTKTHYDKLIEEGNDPFFDSEPLKRYMDQWDGPPFIDALQLTGGETVLEIGVGTGRLADKVCQSCGSFYGIDLSPKTIEAAKSHLPRQSSIHLICQDYLTWRADVTFDVIYSSLTFLHIQDKQAAIQKTYQLLVPGGRFVLSVDRQQSSILDYGTRQIKVYPVAAQDIRMMLEESGFINLKQSVRPLADLFIAEKR